MLLMQTVILFRKCIKTVPTKQICPNYLARKGMLLSLSMLKYHQYCDIWMLINQLTKRLKTWLNVQRRDLKPCCELYEGEDSLLCHISVCSIPDRTIEALSGGQPCWSVVQELDLRSTLETDKVLGVQQGFWRSVLTKGALSLEKFSLKILFVSQVLLDLHVTLILWRSRLLSPHLLKNDI